MLTKTEPSTGNSMMVLETGAGWTRGMKNVLHSELGHWFGTRMWLWQIVIWALSVNLIFLMVAFTGKDIPVEEGIMLFNIFLGLAGPVGVCIIMQSAIVGEKRSGTAAWVLSKPVSRIAFILSKLVANSLGVIVTMVLAQGLIAYLITGLVLHTWLPIPGFMAGLAVQFANLFFYLALTLMLGAILEHPAPVVGIPLAFLFMQQYLAALYPPLIQVIPWTLAIPFNNSQAASISGALMTGLPVTSYAPLVFTLGFSVLFIALALWVFQRQEL